MPFKEKLVDINKLSGDLNDRLAEKYKKPVVYPMKEAPHRPRYRIPFSSFVLNRLSSGGIMVPRIHQLYGPEGVFKSTGMYDLIANYQAIREDVAVGELSKARRVYLLDSEGGSNEQYMARLGVNTDDPELMILDNYDTADEAIDIMADILKSGEAALICIDSLTSLQSSREDQTPMGELIKLQGWGGKFASGMFKKLHNANQGVTGIVFVNQIRDQINDRMERISLDKSGYAPTGGWAPRFYPSLTIEMMHVAEELSDQKLKIPAPDGWVERKTLESWMISARVEKTRMGGNDQQELFFRYSPERVRVDHEMELLNLGMLDGYVRASGSWLKYKLPGMKSEENLGQGRDNARMQLVKHRDLYDRFAAAITAKTEMIARGED